MEFEGLYLGEKKLKFAQMKSLQKAHRKTHSRGKQHTNFQVPLNQNKLIF